MAIEKKLIHFGKLADFEAQLTAGNILDRSIVFIQDAKKIWTHGTYYDCSEGTDVPDSVYVTDFTVNDLLDLVENPDSELSADFQSLYEAFAMHKVVLVPYDPREGFAGYGIANGYHEDMLYFSVKIEGGRCIEAEVNDGDQISGQDVYMATYVPQELLRTINGQSILGSGDLTIEGGAKIYELDLTGRGNLEGYITEEEWNIIKDSDRIKIITDFFSTEIVQMYSPFIELEGDIAVFSSMTSIQGGIVMQYMFTGANATEGSPYSYQIAEVYVPTKTSQLENDSNFITSDGLKTINGESILGSGDITISGGGVSEDYVNTAIANAITTTLNTAV